MCPLVRGKLRDGIDLGRDKQYFKTKYTTCDTKVVNRTMVHIEISLSNTFSKEPI